VKFAGAELAEATVAVTPTVPAEAPLGTTAVHVVADEQLTELAALGPKSKLVAPAAVEKPDPVMVTCTAPLRGASSGVMLLVTGAVEKAVRPFGAPRPAGPL